MTDPAILEEINRFIDALPWIPQEGPQEEAYFSEADLVLYGGAAGGGKTDLAIGLAITMHRETLFIRREAKQLGAVLDRIGAIIDPNRKGWSGQEGRWLIPQWNTVRRQVVIGSTPALGDENKYQGRPRDLLVIDEAANMLESQVRFLMGWVRSTVDGQRCRTLLCSNPPTSAEGYWLTEMFAPWLDPQHPDYPAIPGELRWYAMVEGKEIAVPNGDRFMHDGEEVIPQSRTFIPAKLDDNKYLRDTGYRATLQALPEPLRSQMLYGDFTAGRKDDEYQVIPTDWIKKAMDRWEPKPWENITAVGVDPSRGGQDETVLYGRTGWHFHEAHVWDGYTMATGGDVAGKVMELVANEPCPINVDSIGIGASVVDHLDALVGSRVNAINFAEKATGTDWTGSLKFVNKRAEMWWRMRDLLNPANAQNVALPRDSKLLADLTAPRYQLKSNGIQIEGKTDIVKRLGRSPDRGDALVMCAERGRIMQIEGFRRPPVSVIGSLR